MNELTCLQCQELTAELALDVLPGHQRADALAHLERCPTCQDTVSALTVTADWLIELLPAAEPPPGFEQRVISALTPPAPGALRWWIPAAAGLVAIALAATGWILGRSAQDLTPAQTSTPANDDAQAGERTVLYAPLTTVEQQTKQQQIGQAYLYPGDPSWIYLSLNTPITTPSDTIQCEIIRQDGTSVPLGTFSLTHGHGSWAGVAPVAHDTLPTAKLINSHGHTLAKAHFTRLPAKSDQPTSRHHAPHQRHGRF
jgi:hypothetical protein